MRDYGKIYSHFWVDSTFQYLSDQARLLAAYLLTCEHANMIGCFRIPLAYALCDLAWDEDKLSKAIADLEEVNFLYYDRRTGWVCILKYLKWNKVENPNQAKSVLQLFSKVPPSVVRNHLIDAILKFGNYLTAANTAEIQAQRFNPETKKLFIAPVRPAFNTTKAIQEIVSKVVEEGKNAPKQPIQNPIQTVSEPPEPAFDPIETVSKPFQNSSQALPEPLPKPFPNQEQEQEQEPEQEQEQEKDTLSSNDDSVSQPDDPPGMGAHDLAISNGNGTTFELCPPELRSAGGSKDELQIVREIFDYYLQTVDRNPVTYTLTRTRLQKGKDRLEEAVRMAGGDWGGARTLMKIAVDELADSDWHMGRDPKTQGKRYCDWEKHLFATPECFQRWLEQAQRHTERRQHG